MINSKEVKKAIYDIIVDVSLANISLKYYKNKRHWLISNLSNKDYDFSKEEIQTLKKGLNDLSERIKICADNLENLQK